MAKKCSICTKWFLHNETKMESKTGLAHQKCMVIMNTPDQISREASKIFEAPKRIFSRAVNSAFSPRPSANPPNQSAPNEKSSDVPILLAPLVRPVSIPDSAMPPMVGPVGVHNNNWICGVCFKMDNPLNRSECGFCGTARGILLPVEEVDQSQIDLHRWRCDICTYDSNHPLSDTCCMCYYPVGSIRAPSPRALTKIPVTAVSKLSNSKEIVVKNNERVECVVCGEEFLRNELIFPDRACTSVSCDQCLAGWIEAQISEGNATVLKCPCPGSHVIKYWQFQRVSQHMSPKSVESFHAANRQSVLKAAHIKLDCPECLRENYVFAGQPNYICENSPACSLSTQNIQICVIHNTHHKRCTADGRFELYVPGFTTTQRSCQMCLASVDGDIMVNFLVSSIQDALCDRCPSCQGYVGEPDSFDNCMALYCNHCPQKFCGFCYKFAGNSNETHYHVRHCSVNPRQNYFAESEEIWRDVMKRRKRGIMDALIEQSNLNNTQKNAVRSKIASLL